MFHNLSLCIYSNAFSKLIKLTYKVACHLFTSSIKLRRICSIVPLHNIKPARSYLSLSSITYVILSISIFSRILLITGSKLIPLQFLHYFRFPFLWLFDYQAFFQFVGICSLFQMLLSSSLILLQLNLINLTSAFKNSAEILSIPGDFPIFKFLVAFMISSIHVDGYSQLISHISSLFNTNRIDWSFSVQYLTEVLFPYFLVISRPFSSKIPAFCFGLSLLSILVMLHNVFIFCMFAASSKMLHVLIYCLLSC